MIPEWCKGGMRQAAETGGGKVFPTRIILELLFLFDKGREKNDLVL
jgi:hypothetical protein